MPHALFVALTIPVPADYTCRALPALFLDFPVTCTACLPPACSATLPAFTFIQCPLISRFCLVCLPHPRLPRVPERTLPADCYCAFCLLHSSVSAVSYTDCTALYRFCRSGVWIHTLTFRAPAPLRRLRQLLLPVYTGFCTHTCLAVILIPLIPGWCRYTLTFAPRCCRALPAVCPRTFAVYVYPTLVATLPGLPVARLPLRC